MAKKPTKEQAKAKANVVKTWKDVVGKMKVWARAWDNGKKGVYLSYSTTVSKKSDDEYVNIYYDVLFKKGQSPEFQAECEGFDIDVKAGFLTVRVDSNGQLRPAVMVMDYDIIEK